MGQALRNLELYYQKTEVKHRKQHRIHLNYIENNHTYNNNDDYDLYVLINKSNALKYYLNRNMEKKVENMEPNQDKLLTIPEAAEYCGLRSDKTIRNWIKAGMPFVEVPGKTYPKKLVSILNLDNWRSGKIETKIENKNFANLENTEPVDNLIDKEILTVEPEKYSPQNQQPIKIIDVGRNYMAEVEEKISLALSEQREFFTAALVSIEKKQEIERQENKIVIDTIANENAQLHKKVEHLISRVQRTEEFIERQENKLPWWRKLFNL